MKTDEHEYVKRTQKDYPMSFKLAVVREYEISKISLKALSSKYGIQGSHTIKSWLEKYGNFDWENKNLSEMAQKSKEQELLELRQKVKELEKKNARLEKELEDKDHKVAFFDLMVDMAEEEFKIDIRKKSFPEQ
jgi:transposase